MHVPVPNMLEVLPIIPSRTSQKYYQLFFFILISLPIILVLFQYVLFKHRLNQIMAEYTYVRLPSEFKVKSSSKYKSLLSSSSSSYLMIFEANESPLSLSLTIHLSDYSCIMPVNVL